MNILGVGDYHAKPGVSNERAEWLGKYIVDEEPDEVVLIGDWFDLASLSSYDKGKKKFEGRRYKEDLEAGWDALERLTAPIKLHNSLRKRKLKTKIKITEGNHDNRAERAANDAAELGDFIGRHNFKFEEYGIEAFPFLEVINIAGVNFSHYFPSGAMGRPLGGANPGRAMVLALAESSICGHSHILNFARKKTINNRIIQCGSIGWYGDHIEDYLSESAQADWWSGVVMLKNVKAGEFDKEEVRIDTLRERYA